jgi:hypothetical protein
MTESIIDRITKIFRKIFPPRLTSLFIKTFRDRIEKTETDDNIRAIPPARTVETMLLHKKILF